MNLYTEDKLEKFQIELLRDSYRSICRKDITKESQMKYTENEKQIFYVLKQEAITPVRIVLGYNGFKSEYALREAFVKFMNKNVSQKGKNKKLGYGPANFPTQIICGQFSILKNNGMPLACPLDQDHWLVLATSSEKPLYYLLEYIWTRLSYMYTIDSDIFGEDLNMEQVNRFIDCDFIKSNNLFGWNYNYMTMSNNLLNRDLTGKQWEPVLINAIQFSIISQLGSKGEINIYTDKIFLEAAKESSKTPLELAYEICSTNLIFLENEALKFLTKECHCAILPDGRLVAGDNVTGRLTRWIKNEIGTS
jgi:hypothetical protein